MRRLFILLCLLVSAVAQAGNNPFEVKPDFLPVGKAFVFTSQRLDSGETQLYWQIAEGYYLYQQRLKLDGLADAHKPPLPEGEAHSDEFFGAQQVYRQGLELKIPAGASGKIKVGWQGCADAGLCYPPQSLEVDLGGSPALAGNTPQAADQALAEEQQQAPAQALLLQAAGQGLVCCCSSAWAWCWPLPRARCRCCRSSAGWWWAVAPALVAAWPWPAAMC